MQKIVKGFRFNHDYRDWTVLDRHVNFVLLEGYQMAQPKIFFCANVLTDGGSEVCRPNFMGGDQNSPVWNLELMRKHFETQCDLIDKRIADKESADEVARAVHVTKEMRLGKIIEAKEIRKETLEELRAIINADSTSIKKLMINKKVISLCERANVIDFIINNLKS